jgi:hypothetical protein
LSSLLMPRPCQGFPARVERFLSTVFRFRRVGMPEDRAPRNSGAQGQESGPWGREMKSGSDFAQWRRRVGSAARGPAWKRTAPSSFDERASKAGEVRHDSEMLGAYGRTALTDLLGAWPRSVDSPVYGRGRLPSDREPRVATEGDPQLVGQEPYPERRGR